ncbi:MAG: VTT domain-containing protein [Firmicutes bacterium]|nr:VTT domain-containing protein [Bacillota bacterium]
MENPKEVTDDVKIVDQPADEYAVSLKSRLLRLAVSLGALGIIVTCFILLINFLGFGIFGGNDAAEEAAARLEGYGVAIFFIFFFMYITQAIFLNFIPGTITFFMTFGFFLFGQNVGLLIAVGIVCALSASIIVYTIGRLGGRKLLFWLFGRKHVESKLDWFQRRGIFYVPALYVVPFMTGDLICLICGASKVKFWKFLLIILVSRPIEITLVAFYVPIMRFINSLITPFEMFLLINLMVLNVILFVAYYQKIVATIKKFLGITPKVLTTKDIEKFEKEQSTQSKTVSTAEPIAEQPIQKTTARKPRVKKVSE